MHLKRLSPDLLKETIIEVRYTYELPYHVLAGRIYDSLLKEGFEYKNKPEIQGNTMNIPIDHVFSNEHLNVFIKPNAIIFNKQNEYPLWDNYFKSISKVINVVEDVKFQRIGLRYINEFSNVNIFDFLNDRLEIGFSKFETNLSNLKTEIKDDTFRIILNVGNVSDNEGNKTSVLDIDVLYTLKADKTKDQVLESIDACHSKEKEIFVDLIKSDYLKEHNAEFTE